MFHQPEDNPTRWLTRVIKHNDTAPLRRSQRKLGRRVAMARLAHLSSSGITTKSAKVAISRGYRTTCAAVNVISCWQYDYGRDRTPGSLLPVSEYDSCRRKPRLINRYWIDWR
jgi:hypothetical protein